MLGRRLPDVEFGRLPEGMQPGDIWRYVDKEGSPLSARAHCNGADPSAKVHGNLTDGMWGFYSPDGNGVGTLTLHTVREHEDGTVSILPGDGSSNSIKHQGGNPHREWHGYVRHNDWQPV